jgi:Uma2 family endonuclease
MSAMPVAERMTAEEFLARDDLEHERGVELVDGALVVDNPLPRHQFICLDLAMALSRWTADAEGRGLVTLPLDVRLDEHNVYGPDLLWYAEGRGPKRSGSGRPSPIPDLAVEVRSPSTWRYDIGTKKSVYEREGLPELSSGSWTPMATWCSCSAARRPVRRRSTSRLSSVRATR